MDGFASSADTQIRFLIFITFPTFMFTLNKAKSTDKLKGITLLLITSIAFYLGLQWSIGKEGYLADYGGEVFCFVILELVIIGLLYLFKNKQYSHQCL